MNKFKHFFLALLAVTFAFTSCSKNDAEDDFDYGDHLPTNYPSGYYKSAEGKTTAELKTALYNIVKGHNRREYSQLWTDFRATDARPDGKVWDLYDNKTNFTFGKDQQDYTSGVVGRYNREHSFPKSWFNTTGNPSQEESKSIYTDLFHLYPANGAVNEVRSNYTYFPVTKPINKVVEDKGKKEYFKNTYCKFGESLGYSNKYFFEPADEIKGDLARSYFYMATRYENGENGDLSKWPGSGGTNKIEILTKTSYPFYKEPMLSRLLQWHRQDPVSDKEVKRNEAIYKIQGNRNPFIDCPDMAEYIWGSKMGQPYHETK